MDRDTPHLTIVLSFKARTVLQFLVMSYNIREMLVAHHPPNNSLKATFQERKGLPPSFDAKGRSGELPCYADETYQAGPSGCTLLQRNVFAWIASGLIALILGAAFFAQVPRRWCGSIGATSQPPRLLSNGTHEFKRTVVIVSIDGLR